MFGLGCGLFSLVCLFSGVCGFVRFGFGAVFTFVYGATSWLVLCCSGVSLLFGFGCSGFVGGYRLRGVCIKVALVPWDFNFVL